MASATAGIERWRRSLGRVGVWLFGQALDEDPAGVAGRIEALGYRAMWVGGGNTTPATFERLDRALSGTSRLVVATGIASIWAWEPGALLEQTTALATAHPGRFLLGLGVSHQHLVEHLGRRYERPYSAMVGYLEQLRAASASVAGEQPVLVLAALGDKMLRLSAEQTLGSHPYFTPAEHTAHARAVLGPEPILAPEVALVLERDPALARSTARSYMERYLALPNYAGNLRRHGFGDEDFASGGSERLVDAIVAWGGAQQVAERVRAHLSAGADHVCVQPLAVGGGLDLAALEELAPLLLVGP